MTPINVGILGLGHIGKYHIEALNNIPELSLVAACDLDPALACLVPAGVHFYRHPEELLNQTGVETVIIATPNHTHYDLADLALDHGKNIILEKPATSSMEELQALEKRRAQSTQHIYYAFHAAKAFDVSWFTQYYNSSAVLERLGPVTGFACHFYDPYIEAGNLKAEARSLGNSWIDSGVNALSVLAEWFDLSEFVPLSATFTPFSDTLRRVQACVQYQFPVGTAKVGGLGTINTNWALGLNRKETWLSFGLSGHLVKVDHSRQHILETGPKGQVIRLQDFSTHGPRLLNHYLGVFRDYVISVRRNLFNTTQSLAIHQLLLTSQDETVSFLSTSL
jgi:predicted dehydrogenase